MADCRYHAQSSPGPCAECQANRAAGQEDNYSPPVERSNSLAPSVVPAHYAELMAEPLYSPKMFQRLVKILSPLMLEGPTVADDVEKLAGFYHEAMAARRALAFDRDAAVSPEEIERTITALYDDMKAQRARLAAGAAPAQVAQTLQEAVDKYALARWVQGGDWVQAWENVLAAIPSAQVTRNEEILLGMYERHKDWAQRSGYTPMSWEEFNASRLENPLSRHATESAEQ